jgi:hypothetical protein
MSFRTYHEPLSVHLLVGHEREQPYEEGVMMEPGGILAGLDRGKARDFRANYPQRLVGGQVSHVDGADPGLLQRLRRQRRQLLRPDRDNLA